MEKSREGEALETFRSYSSAFQRLDAREVATYFFEPSLLINPDAVIACSSRDRVEQEYTRIMTEAKAQGYAKTEFARMEERCLAPDVAVVSGVAAWKKVTGEPILRFGMTYLLRETSQGWRIVVSTIHDPDMPLFRAVASGRTPPPDLYAAP